MYDCLTYEDGTPGAYTEERIARIKAMCKSEAEVLRRVYGRFVAETGLVYETFERQRHYIQPHTLPPDWRIFAGVDIGSGGNSGHPAAIVFVASNPNYTQFRVVDLWRGDKILTTTSDILAQYKAMKARNKFPHVQAYYDYASKDFGIIAMRTGEPFLPAEKGHDTGETTLNVLFKNDLLKIYKSFEAEKLVTEILTLRKGDKSRHQKNDLVDALRYAISSIPIDWGIIEASAVVVEPKKLSEQDIRRQAFDITGRSEDELMAELDEWNEAYG
jgi:hypothetical protein